MLDPVREKRDLHIRATGILVMQLELLKIHRLVALSHNEGPIVAEEAIFATTQTSRPASVGVFLSWMAFPFTVVPKAELCPRTDSAGTAEDYAKEFAQKMFRRIHAQFTGRCDNRFLQHFETAQLF
jgi:hypothetical protein